MKKLLLLLVLTSTFCAAQLNISLPFRSNTGTEDPFAACKLTDTTGWTLLNAPGTIDASGNYYLAPNTPLVCDDTCFMPTVNNVTINLNGNTVTYGANQTEFPFTDQPEIKGTSDGGGETNADQDRIVMKGLWSAITEITRIGDAPGTSDYIYGTDFRICEDRDYATGHNCGDGRYIMWVGAHKPAAGATYYVTGKYKEPASALFLADLSGNTTSFSTVPVAGIKTNVGMKCGTLVAHPNASAWSSGMIHTGTDGFLEDIVWSTSNPNAFNQHAWLNEGQTGGEIRRVTATSVSRWVLSRDNNHGGIFRMMGTGVAGNGTIVENNTILDAPHVGYYIRNVDSVVRNNYIKPRATKFTNSFAIGAYGTMEIYGNTINCWDPNNLDVGCRGIYLSASAWAHNNTVTVHGHNTNLEYSGCEFSGSDNPTGGPFGIQMEGSNSSHTNDNDVTGVADACGAAARRYTNAGTLAAPVAQYFQNEVYRAFKTSATSAGDAVGLSILQLYGDTTNTIGAAGADTRIEADTYNITFLHKGNVTLKRMVLTKGTEDPKYTCGNPANTGVDICSHPSATYHTFRFQGYGDTQTLNCVDCEARNGASLTDVSGFVENSLGNWYKHYDLWIKWSRTFNVKVGGVNQAGFDVVLTDVASGTYSNGQTDANGNVTIEVPQYHVYNNTSTAVNTATLNPYSVAISKAGCSTVNLTNQSYSSAGTTNVSTTCP